MDPPQSYVHFPGGINHNVPPPTVAANGARLQYANTLQHPPPVVSPMHMGNEWIEKQINATETLLRDRGFPQDTWDYYLNAPRDWDIDDIDPVGVHRGVKAILTSRGRVNPWWIPDSDNGKKVKLSTSFIRVTQTLEEVKRFTSESMPDDSQLRKEPVNYTKNYKMHAMIYQPWHPALTKSTLNSTTTY